MINFCILTVLTTSITMVTAIKDGPQTAISNECGENFYDGPGIIKSPQYPGPYKPFTACKWFIHARRGYFIEITIQEFHTNDKTSKSPGDVMKIYDRHINDETDEPKWIFSGYLSPRKFLIRSNSAWIHFNSDHIPPAEGMKFLIRYSFLRIHDCPDPGNPDFGTKIGNDHRIGAKISFVCDPGYVINGASVIECKITDSSTQPHWSHVKPQCQAPCSNSNDPIILEKQSDVILSQNYPGYYLRNSSCNWMIQMNETYLHVNLTAEIFDLAQGDVLTVYGDFADQTNVAHFTKDNPLKSIVSYSDVMNVTFSSGPHSRGGVFNLQYYPYSNSSSLCLSPPKALNMLTTEKSYYDRGDGVSYSCEEGYFLTRKNSENFYSTCLGENTWSVTNTELPSCVSHCKRWNSDDDIYEDVVLTDQTGVILSPGYPDQMFKGTTCSYTIQVNVGQNVEVVLDEINIDDSTIIDISDEDKESGSKTLIRRITKNNIPVSYKTRSNSARVVVSVQKTSGETNGRFILRYRAVISEFCSKPVVSHGSVTWDNFTIGSGVVIKCNPFFELSGAVKSVCTSDGLTNRWHPQLGRCIGACGGLYSREQGVIVSPQYPDNYHDPDPCLWSVQLDEGVYTVTLTVLQLYQPTGSSIEIISGAYEKLIEGECSIGKSCLNVTFELSQSRFHLRLKPGFNTEGIIFKIQYVATLKYRPPKLCKIINNQKGRLVAIGVDRKEESKVMFRCVKPFDLVGSKETQCMRQKSGLVAWYPPIPSCEIQCKSDGVIRRNNNGAVASPGYPETLAPGKHSCSWKIDAGTGRVVRLIFSYFEIPAFDGNSNFMDIKEVYTDKEKLLTRVINQEHPENLTSSSSIIRIVLELNVKPNTKLRGFYVSYMFVKPVVIVPPTLLVTSTVPAAVTQTSSKPSTTQSGGTSLKQTADDGSKVTSTSNTHVIVGSIIGCVAIVLLILGFIYYWYRKRYPVRLVVGRKIKRFHNPIYDRPLSTISTTTLYSGSTSTGGSSVSGSIEGLDAFGVRHSPAGLDNLAFQISIEEETGEVTRENKSKQSSLEMAEYSPSGCQGVVKSNNRKSEFEFSEVEADRNNNTTDESEGEDGANINNAFAADIEKAANQGVNVHNNLKDSQRSENSDSETNSDFVDGNSVKPPQNNQNPIDKKVTDNLEPDSETVKGNKTSAIDNKRVGLAADDSVITDKNKTDTDHRRTVSFNDADDNDYEYDVKTRYVDDAAKAVPYTASPSPSLDASADSSSPSRDGTPESQFSSIPSVEISRSPVPASLGDVTSECESAPVAPPRSNSNRSRSHTRSKSTSVTPEQAGQAPGPHAPPRQHSKSLPPSPSGHRPSAPGAGGTRPTSSSLSIPSIMLTSPGDRHNDVFEAHV